MTNSIAAKIKRSLYSLRRKWIHLYLRNIKKFHIGSVCVKSVIHGIKAIRISTFSLLLLCTVVLFMPRTFLYNESIPSTIASIIGTILALVFTLSIIPIQTAVTDWSASISKLYRNDGGVKVAFIVIALLLVGTLLLPNEESISCILSIFFLAISLDIVRWYYVHVCCLLDPNIAIKKLEDEIKKSINRYQIIVKKHSSKLKKILTYDQFNITEQLSIEKILFAQPTAYIDLIKNDLDSITEFSLKALSRNDSVLVKNALSSLSNVIKYYGEIRKDNLVVTHSAETLFLVPETDADSFLNYAYDLIKQVGLAAVEKNDNSVCEAVFKEYCELAKYFSLLNKDTSFMVSSPIAYMKLVVTASIQKKMFDAPYSAGLKLCRLANDLPKESRYEHTYQPILELIQTISLYYIVLGSPAVTNELVKSISIFLSRLYDSTYRQFSEILPIVLNIYCTIISLSLITEKQKLQGIVLQTSITNAYATISEQSLSKLIKKCIEKDDMHEILNVFEILKDHFKEIAVSNDFGTNRILDDVQECIFDILKYFIGFASQKNEDDADVIFAKMIRPLLSILSLFFLNKTSIDASSECKAANIIAYVTLASINFDWNRDNLFDYSAQLIKKLIENHYKINSNVNEYSIITMLMLLWRLKFITEKYKMTAVAANIDEIILEIPNEFIQNETWNKLNKSAKKKHESTLEYIQTDNQWGFNTVDPSLDIVRYILQTKS